MAILVILVSSDSSDDSVGTPAERVILFGTIITTIPNTTPVIAPPTTQTDTTVIPTDKPIITPTIPPSPDYRPASLDYSPASETESDPSEDPSSGHIPPLPAHIDSLSLMVDRTAARKRVGPLPIQQLAMRHYVDHSSSDSSSRHSLSDHSSPDLRVLLQGHLTRDVDVKVGPREIRVERVTHPAMPEDILEPAQEGAVEVIEDVQREQGHRIVGVESAVTALTERVAELERDNRRLRDTASVESQRVDRLQRGMSRMQREMRQMRRF
nr:hypothetical protein [Tanacetum cinerariifolium]